MRTSKRVNKLIFDEQTTFGSMQTGFACSKHAVFKRVLNDLNSFKHDKNLHFVELFYFSCGHFQVPEIASKNCRCASGSCCKFGRLGTNFQTLGFVYDETRNRRSIEKANELACCIRLLQQTQFLGRLVLEVIM